MMRFVVAILGTLAAAGCVHDWRDEPIGDLSTATIPTKVFWQDNCTQVTEAIRKLEPTHPRTCGFAMRFGDSLCLIWAVKPATWWDRSAQEILGEEVLHCFNARHPPRT